MLNIVVLVILLAGSALFVWLSVRAWRLKRAFARWGSLSLSVLLAGLFGATAVVMLIGLQKVHSRGAPVPDLTIASTAEQINRGHAIASTFCDACHSSDGTLTGGRDLGEHFPVPIGRLVTANLTPAGLLSRWSDGEIFRAIRNSVDADGHWLTIMSLTNASKLSDGDIRALIAYIRSVPAAGQPTPNPPDQLNPLGLLMLGAGILPAGKPVFTGTITAPSQSATREYGEYILSYQDCRGCHGADLTGGVPGQLGPIGPGLALVKDWKLEEFIATLRTGVDPSGHQLNNSVMPWRVFGKMSDDELSAIYRYLVQLPQS
jgi:cytochrome c553